MRLRKLLDDDDAVSPVIGVILMVAITVILAAVIASFVLGLGPSGGQQPTASFGFDYTTSESNLTITHGSGDQIKVGNLYVRGDFGDSDFTNGEWNSFTGVNDSEYTASGDIGGTTAVSSGDTLVLDGVGSSYDLNVVWETDEGSATLSSDDGPDA
jgi:flagellin-like protein